MKILYQSEVTGKTYQTEEALKKAEAAVSEAKKAEEQKKKERAEAAKVVEDKIAAANAAVKDANAAVSDFCSKYGTFKTTLKDGILMSPFSLLLDNFFGF